MEFVFVGFVLVCGLVWMAWQGTWTRPVYVAGILVSLVSAFGGVVLLPSPGDLARATSAAELAGVEALATVLPVMILLCLAAAFGCLLAVILYRRRPGVAIG